jgi:hypothetical protein
MFIQNDFEFIMKKFANKSIFAYEEIDLIMKQLLQKLTKIVPAHLI